MYDLRFSAHQLSKKFNREWIFKNVSFEFSGADVIGITGSNGSGKSTLLQILSGYLIPSSGEIKLFVGDVEITAEDFYKHISLSSPFLELVEEFTLEEQLNFYFKFKKSKNSVSVSELLSMSLLAQHAQKQIRNFSSGMKQRVKLLMAMASDTSLLLLDEPCTNLDSSGIEWYKKMLTEFKANRIVIISSNNQPDELFMCNKFISMDDFKSLI